MLRDQGNLNGAIALYRENLSGNAKDEPARREIARLEGMRNLLLRLPGIVSGTACPASPSEAVEFAELCAMRFQTRYAAATRLYREEFAADSKLSDDLVRQHRYNAASTAVRAARGVGADAPADPAARADLRAKALGWRRADLALHAKQAASSSAAERKRAADRLSSWPKEAALSGTRPGVGRIGMPATVRPT